MKKTSLRDYLVDEIPENLHEFIPTSFEIVGDIAIIEIPEELLEYKNTIGNSLLKVNSAIKVVLSKSGIHKGEFRTQDLDYLAGENRKETEYLENGIRLLINPETVYFSARLSTERADLLSNLEPGKRVLMMFSGLGPYTFVALKKQPNLALIDSVEINPEGHKYALKNLELNKNLLKKSDEFKKKVEELRSSGKYVDDKKLVSDLISERVHFYNGDIREVVKTDLKDKKYDEIFMPLPKDAYHFLECSFEVSDKGCIIHMYDFVHEENFPHDTENRVKDAAQKFGKKVQIIRTRKVGQYSPRKYRVCCDFRVD